MINSERTQWVRTLINIIVAPIVVPLEWYVEGVKQARDAWRFDQEIKHRQAERN
jgi:hypothetical protein